MKWAAWGEVGVDGRDVAVGTRRAWDGMQWPNSTSE